MRKKRTIKELLKRKPSLSYELVNSIVSSYEAKFKRMVNNSLQELNCKVPYLGTFKFHGNSKNKNHKVYGSHSNKKKKLKNDFSDEKLLF
jgi:hypothetical protein